MNAGPCPLCEAHGAPVFDKSGHTHLECQRCRTWYVDPIPGIDALAAFYRDVAADQNSRICWNGTSRHAHASWRRALGDAERLGGRGPLLDLGCGAGQFLAFARERGWTDLEGIEVAPGPAAVAREAAGARIHEATLDTAPVTPGRFAMVTAWDVLEHLPEPRRALERAFALLRPGGVLALSTPNRHGITIRCFRDRALLVMPPEHLFLATSAGLRAAAAGVGLELVRLATLDVHLRQWVEWVRDVRGRSRATGAPRDGEREAYAASYARITGSAVFDGVQALGNVVLRATRLGDALLAVFRRPDRS